MLRKIKWITLLNFLFSKTNQIMGDSIWWEYITMYHTLMMNMQDIELELELENDLLV